MAITRRQFIKGAAVTGVALALPLKFGVGTAQAFAQSPQLRKWIQPIRGLGGTTGIPVMNGVEDPAFGPNTKFYRITIGEFSDVLHPDMGGVGVKAPTKLWGYWDTTDPVKRHLAGVILANRGTASRIRFTNMLPPTHILPVDLTVTAASPAQNRTATHLHGGLVPWICDGGPFNWFGRDADPQTPNGAFGLSFLNGMGSVLDNIKTANGALADQLMVAGQADYYYPNDQSFRLVWYHDHAWGITRLNAYAGIASAYLIQDTINDYYTAPSQGFSNGKIPGLGSTKPLVWQDKIFVWGAPASPGVAATGTWLTDPTWATSGATGQSAGSLWYAHVYDPKLYRLFKGNKVQTTPLSNPSVVPEFFGDTMLCNGTVYPIVEVQAKRYRFLMLNACNARFLNINAFTVPSTLADLATDPKTGFVKAGQVGVAAGPQIIQIGTEGGFLAQEVVYPNNLPFNPATLTGNLMLGSAERADVIIDFTGLTAGQDVIFYNDAPGPFPVGAPTNDYYLGNPKNPAQPAPGTGPDTRQILRFRVIAGGSDPQPAGQILIPALIDPPLFSTPPFPVVGAIAPLPNPAGAAVIFLTLNEDFDQYGRLRQLLGTTVLNPITGNYGQPYEQQPPKEIVVDGATQVWIIYNLTADTHPIHFHLTNVQVLSRQPFRLNNGRFNLSGVARGPEPNELGWKETVKMHPGEATTVAMKFDLPAVPFTVAPSTRFAGTGISAAANEYVWHCHILEHEEHDMMRPLVVTGASPTFGVQTSLETVIGAGPVTFPVFGSLTGFSVTPDPTNVANTITFTKTETTFVVTVPSGTTAGRYNYKLTDSSAIPQQTALATVEIL